MRVKYPDGRSDEVRRLSVSDTAEVTIQIEERDGQQLIVIREQHPDEPVASQNSVEIPASLLPELKRAVTELEVGIADENSSNENSNNENSSNENPRNDDAATASGDRRFAHASEEEFARILDFYHIAWQYEPRTFPIEWDGAGNVTKSFTPDFYLPEYDLYIELTTLKQALVTKKNRKVRLLRELYPEVNIKVLYASDYRKLVEKFAASGTWQEGQPPAEEK